MLARSSLSIPVPSVKNIKIKWSKRLFYYPNIFFKVSWLGRMSKRNYTANECLNLFSSFCSSVIARGNADSAKSAGSDCILRTGRASGNSKHTQSNFRQWALSKPDVLTKLQIIIFIKPNISCSLNIHSIQFSLVQ